MDSILGFLHCFLVKEFCLGLGPLFASQAIIGAGWPLAPGATQRDPTPRNHM